MKQETVINNTSKFTSHSVTMTDRKKASMTGVTKVDGAGDNEISLTTCLGRLIVSGTELKIVKFDEQDGDLTISGNIDGLKYAQQKAPLLKRIFK